MSSFVDYQEAYSLWCAKDRACTSVLVRHVIHCVLHPNLAANWLYMPSGQQFLTLEKVQHIVDWVFPSCQIVPHFLPTIPWDTKGHQHQIKACDSAYPYKSFVSSAQLKFSSRLMQFSPLCHELFLVPTIIFHLLCPNTRVIYICAHRRLHTVPYQLFLGNYYCRRTQLKASIESNYI